MNYEKQLKQFLIKSLKNRFGSIVDDIATEDDIIVVWFSKTLQNAKGLFYIPVISPNNYYEVTYNGDTLSAYIDTYEKISNDEVALND